MLEKLPEAIGQALSGIRPGLEKIASHGPDFAEVPSTIAVASPAFADGASLPVRFTEDGDGLSPPLRWTGVPAGAGGVVLLIEDADSPTPSPLVHTILWGLPGRDGELAEGALPRDNEPGEAVGMGKNSFYGAEYLPPDPPPGHGLHRYAFQIFAVREPLDFDTPPGRSAFLSAIKGNALARGLLIGTYERAEPG